MQPRGDSRSMKNDGESRRLQLVELFRKAQPTDRCLGIPHITIRGDNNLITVGAGAVVKAEARRFDERRAYDPYAYWPRQILDAIKVKAIENRISTNDLCEIAQNILGRVVLTIDKLSARDLARVYEALCAGETSAPEETINPPTKALWMTKKAPDRR